MKKLTENLSRKSWYVYATVCRYLKHSPQGVKIIPLRTPYKENFQRNCSNCKTFSSDKLTADLSTGLFM